MALRDRFRKRQAGNGQDKLPRHSLGELLVECGLVTEDQLDLAVRFQKQNADIMLGEALVKIGALDRDTLEVLLTKQRALRRRGDRDVIDLARAAARRASMAGFATAAVALQDKFK